MPWISFCDILIRLQPVHKCIVVHWIKPDMDNVKINTDGSYLKVEGKAGLGGALRDENGDSIMAFSLPYSCENHNLAEAYAAWTGINWCVQNGFTIVTLELDSLYIVDILRHENTTNYRLSQITDMI